MKGKFLAVVIVAIAILSSCGNDETAKNAKPTKEELIEKITFMEDSLKGLQSNLSETKKIPNLTHFELINRLLDYYHNYPEDVYSAECLDKVHMKYSGLGIHIRAVEYGDTLLKKYPKYINRAMVLESLGSTYDVFIQPRDTAKIRYYYSLLLKENPSMEKDKKEGLKDRLNHLDLNFDQFIDYKMAEIAKK